MMMIIIIMMMTPPLFLDQTEAQRAEKIFFFNTCDAMWDDRTITRSEFFLNFILVTIGIERA